MKRESILSISTIAVSLLSCAHTNMITAPNELVGSWKRPNQTVFVKISVSGKAFQCRMTGDLQNITIFTASGNLTKLNTVTWDDMVMEEQSRKTFIIDDQSSDQSRFTWGVEKISLEHGKLVLEGKYGRWEYERSSDLMPDKCKSPI